MQLSRVIGATGLIVGTSIGAGMLALPSVTAAGGFLNAVFVYGFIWLITTICAFFLLEVNLHFEKNSNIISMAEATLGSPGKVLAWICYILLLYTLLSAYLSACSEILENLLSFIGIPLPDPVSNLLVALLFSAIIYNGILVADWVNRGFLLTKLIAFIVLIFLLSPHIELSYLSQGKLSALSPALMVIVTAFGYSIIIPSIRSYLGEDVKAMRLSIILGSLIPLVSYLIWCFIVQGSLDPQAENGLLTVSDAAKPNISLIQLLGLLQSSDLIYLLTSSAHAFASLCVITSFLGVSLSLSDFLSDGLHVVNRRKSKWFICLLTFSPPLIIVLFTPSVFVVGLTIAGYLVVVLLLLLPISMVISARYIKKLPKHHYQVIGGASTVLFAFIGVIAILLFSHTSYFF